MNKPMASVRPMQVDNTQAQREGGGPRRWIPAEVWQKQGMTAQEMTLPSGGLQMLCNGKIHF